MRTLVIGTLLLVMATAAGAQDFSRIDFRHQELAPNVHWLRGAGGNVLACTGPEGVLLVDADYEEMSEKLVQAVADLEAGPVRLVINTHWHFDHVGGNARLAADGAVIMAHEASREFMTADRHLEVIDADVPASSTAAWPAIVITEPLIIHWGNEEIAVIPAPGHTGGDLIVHFRTNNILHAGDLFFNCGYPYIDTAHGGSIDGFIEAGRFVLEQGDDETLIVPGHGPVVQQEEARPCFAMIADYRDLVSAEKARGGTLAEAIESKPAAAIDAEWGDEMFPPEAFIEMIWTSLPDDLSGP